MRRYLAMTIIAFLYIPLVAWWGSTHPQQFSMAAQFWFGVVFLGVLVTVGILVDLKSTPVR